jgi:hypothetical protein
MASPSRVALAIGGSRLSSIPLSWRGKVRRLLRQSLAPLNLEQLKDIIADYGMDPSKLAMKWKTPKRIIDRIVEVSLGRAAKGDVFLRGRPT